MDQVIVLPVLGGCPTWSSLCGLWESVLYSHYWAGRQADSHVLRQPGRADICVHAQLERGDNSRNVIVLVWQFVCNCVRMYCKFIDCQTVGQGDIAICLRKAIVCFLRIITRIFKSNKQWLKKQGIGKVPMDSYCFMKRLQLWWMDQYEKIPLIPNFVLFKKHIKSKPINHY